MTCTLPVSSSSDTNSVVSARDCQTRCPPPWPGASPRHRPRCPASRWYPCAARYLPVRSKAHRWCRWRLKDERSAVKPLIAARVSERVAPSAGPTRTGTPYRAEPGASGTGPDRLGVLTPHAQAQPDLVGTTWRGGPCQDRLRFLSLLQRRGHRRTHQVRGRGSDQLSPRQQSGLQAPQVHADAVSRCVCHGHAS